eukprot:386174-Ditylum_brightwellii.AAC.1
MKEFFSEFLSRNRLKECHHKYDTQLNEGLNTAVATVVPKHKTYELGMDMTDGFFDFLESNDKTQAQRQDYKKLTTTKMKRKKDDYER